MMSKETHGLIVAVVHLDTRIGTRRIAIVKSGRGASRGRKNPIEKSEIKHVGGMASAHG